MEEMVSRLLLTNIFMIAVKYLITLNIAEMICCIKIYIIVSIIYHRVIDNDIKN